MKVESMKISFFISHQDLTFSLCSIQIFYIINSVLGSRLCTHISQCMFESSRCKNGNESSCERWREEEAQAFAWMEESRWDRKKGNSWNSSFSECCELSSKQHIPSKENICWNFCIKNLHSLFSYRFKLLYRRRHFSFLFSFFHQTKTNVWFSVISVKHWRIRRQRCVFSILNSSLSYLSFIFSCRADLKYLHIFFILSLRRSRRCQVKAKNSVSFGFLLFPSS